MGTRDAQVLHEIGIRGAIKGVLQIRELTKNADSNIAVGFGPSVSGQAGRAGVSIAEIALLKRESCDYDDDTHGDPNDHRNPVPCPAYVKEDHDSENEHNDSNEKSDEKIGSAHRNFEAICEEVGRPDARIELGRDESGGVGKEDPSRTLPS